MNWQDYQNNFKIRMTESGHYTEQDIQYYLDYAETLHNNQLPIIFNIKHLSELTGISTKYIYKIIYAENNVLYENIKLQKKNGGIRNINIPFPNLAILQNWILKNILENIPISKFAKAYHKNTSVRDNAKFHRNQKKVLKLDIKDFFGSILHKDIFYIFYNLGYTKSISDTLVKITTLDNRGVPQGAATSPYISNLILKNFDEEIGNFCIKKNIRYSRYADDMTFSGDFDEKIIIRLVKRKLKKRRLTLNTLKTKIFTNNEKQIVTGIIVNKKLQLDISVRKNIRLEVYFLEKNPYEHLSRISDDVNIQEKYLLSLIGKINYALHINPKDQRMIEYKNTVYIILKEIFP